MTKKLFKIFPAVLLGLMAITLFLTQSTAQSEELNSPPSSDDFVAYYPFILNQSSSTGDATNDKKIVVGQVFRPENSGVIDKISMKANLTGSGVQHYHLKIYEWFGGSGDNPADIDYQNESNFLAEADPRTISHNLYDQIRYNQNIIWEFTGDNEILLKNDQYYFLEIDFEKREDVPEWGSGLKVNWLGTSNASLIDGQVWQSRNGSSWESPPSDTELRDLYLVMEGEIALMNTPPFLNDLGQFKADGETPIEVISKH